MLFWILFLGSDTVSVSLGHQYPPCLSNWTRYPIVSLGFPISTGVSANSLGLPSVLPHPCCFSYDPPLAHPFLSVTPVLQLKTSSALVLQCFPHMKWWKLSEPNILLAPRNTLQLFISSTTLTRGCCVVCSSVSFRKEQLFCMWGQANAKSEEEGRKSCKRKKRSMGWAVGKGRG